MVVIARLRGLRHMVWAEETAARAQCMSESHAVAHNVGCDGGNSDHALDVRLIRARGSPRARCSGPLPDFEGCTIHLKPALPVSEGFASMCVKDKLHNIFLDLLGEEKAGWPRA